MIEEGLNCYTQQHKYFCELYLSIGRQLNHTTATPMLHNCKIQKPDWEKIGNILGLKAYIDSTAFFVKWRNHALPSWENLALALKKIKQYKHAETACQARAGKAFHRFA